MALCAQTTEARGAEQVDKNDLDEQSGKYTVIVRVVVQYDDVDSGGYKRFF